MPNPPGRPYQRALASSSGFTLIELMIVVVIIAILAAVALPSYRRQVLKSHRVDAKNAVLELAARQEKFFATNNTYSTSGTALNYGREFPINVNSGGQSFYVLSVSQATTADFTVTATPIGTQKEDPCHAYVVNNLGVQSNLAATGSANTMSGCW